MVFLQCHHGGVASSCTHTQRLQFQDQVVFTAALHFVRRMDSWCEHDSYNKFVSRAIYKTYITIL